jgi:hypothetical protein
MDERLLEALYLPVERRVLRRLGELARSTGAVRTTSSRSR